MNTALWLQCGCMYALHNIDRESVDPARHNLLMNSFFVLHNAWLILCDIALTGILLNVLAIVSTVHVAEETKPGANKAARKRMERLLVVFCALFVTFTLLFHALAVILRSAFWDVIGGTLRNLLIAALCLVLAKNTATLQRSVQTAFDRVRVSLSSDRQLAEHRRIIRVLRVLLVLSLVLVLLVSVAAGQYMVDLWKGGEVRMSFVRQPLPGSNVTDVVWLFMKLMSSLIVLYYAVVNMRQRRKAMVSILNEEMNAINEKRRAKRRRSRSQRSLMML